jgi:hypothetical protein
MNRASLTAPTSKPVWDHRTSQTLKLIPLHRIYPSITEEAENKFMKLIQSIFKLRALRPTLYKGSYIQATRATSIPTFRHYSSVISPREQETLAAMGKDKLKFELKTPKGTKDCMLQETTYIRRAMLTYCRAGN